MSKPSKFVRRAAAATALVPLAVLSAHAVAATQYDVVVLNQNGGEAYGVYDGLVVGSSPLAIPTVWTNLGRTSTLLPLPPGYTPAGGERFAIFGDQVGGFAYDSSDNVDHALLWSGFNSQPVDLGAFSGVTGIYHGIEAGSDAADHAAIWYGTAASRIDLSPQGATFYTETTGIWGNEVSGTWHRDPTGSDPHAAVWTSLSPSGFVDLSGPTDPQGAALAVSRGQVAGWAAVINAGKHAAVWTDSAASFIDLAPAGTTASELFGTNGTQQAGDVSLLPGGGGLPPDHHAAVWTGTAGSYQLLPLPGGANNTVINSFAYGIDGEGDIVGTIGPANQPVPALWIPHRLPGDANFDGIVDFSDLLVLAQHYGQPGEWVDGEFSGGGTVNFADLLTLAQHYGQTQSADQLYSAVSLEADAAPGQVPEPAAAAAAVAFASILARRRTRPISSHNKN